MKPLSDNIQAGLGVSTTCLRNPPTSNQIANGLIDSIYSIVKQFNEELQTLALYIDKQLPSSEQVYRSLKNFGKWDIPWTNVDEAATRFNDLRCEQLLGTFMQTRSPDIGLLGWDNLSVHFTLR